MFRSCTQYGVTWQSRLVSLPRCYQAIITLKLDASHAVSRDPPNSFAII
jgi:hypothetical protein